MTEGEIGCAASHYELWEECAAGNDIFLILEGDARCDNAYYFKNRVEQIHDILNEDYYDFCYLGRYPLSKDSTQCNSAFDSLLVKDNFVFPGYNWLTHAYMISPKGARKLMKDCMKLAPADEWIPYKINKGKNYHKRFLCLPEMELDDRLRAIAHADPNFVYQERKNESTTEATQPVFRENDARYDASNYNYALCTVATDVEKEGFSYMVRSFTNNDWHYSWNLGDNVEWHGGNMEMGSGGGLKINLLWPDVDLHTAFPEHPTGNNFLNSGCFIGLAKNIRTMLDRILITDSDDDQLAYQTVFLVQEKLSDIKEFKIELDHNNLIFQCLSGATDQIELFNYVLHNKLTHSNPSIIHGNGGTKEKAEFFKLCDYFMPPVYDEQFLEMKQNSDFQVGI
jgi:GR25 family glycosyltransferase involved in LPS biosynthesis